MPNTSDELLHPTKIYSRSEILSVPSPVPRSPGVYAWSFRDIPPGVPTEGCITHTGLTLLYIGISPKAPPKNGRPRSTQTIQDRIRYHMRGNAAGSTLRLTLGCLLSDSLGIQLRRVGSGRLTFAEGEQQLNGWLDENAFVVWKVSAEPWIEEEELIQVLSLPLNLDQNYHHPFHPTLSAVRRNAKAVARSLPILKPRMKSLPLDDLLQSQDVMSEE